MKIKRTKKDYGGGSGITIFESDLFDVIVWKLAKGTRTTITVADIPFCEVHFDGEHEFTSDELCMEQLTVKEIRKLIEHQNKQAFEDGIRFKINEIRDCLGIHDPNYY